MANSDIETRMIAPRPESMKPPDAFETQWSDPPPPNDVDDPLVGQTLQRTYKVTRIIGEGGMGRVYEALHTRISNKRFALKVLHPEFSREPEVRTRFRREAEAAACISHPNVVGVYDVAVTDQGWPFLVCEFLEGMDFADLIKERGALEPALATHVVLQVCDALIAAHERGVIHRDLKPQNVFLLGGADTQRPQAKVLDFGLSRFTDGSDNSLTKTGMIMGTPSYMAPEQARGERTDNLTDVYGAGAILYAAVTGRPPFNEETPQATLLAVMNYDPPRPHTLNPAVSVYLEMVIQKAMAKKPSERYPNMEAFRDALLALDVGELASPASRALSPSSADLDEVTTARSQLILYTLAGATVLTTSLAAAVTGTVYVFAGHWPFSKTEVFLSVLVVVGTLLTPVILLLRKLSNNVWSSTARVVGLLQQVKAPVLAGLLTYGSAALALRFIDGSVLGNPASLAWPGWSALLFLVALIVAGMTWIRKRWATGETSGTRRALFGPGLFAIGTMLCGAVLYGGLQLRQTHPVWATIALAPQTTPEMATEPASSAAAISAASAAPAVKATATAAPEEKAPEPEPVEEEEIALASSSELSSAVAKGTSALEELEKKYPKDPKVLRALVMDHGSRASGLSEAMKAMQQLFAASPDAIKDKNLQVMIRRTSAKSPPASNLAYQLMSEHMGTEGTDMLYQLSLSKPSQRDDIMRYLAKPAARKNFTPALEIAFDLHNQNSCKARLPLLKRAEEVGDERSIRILSNLASGTSKGCGYKKRKPCKALCPSLAEQFKKTIEVISKRGS